MDLRYFDILGIDWRESRQFHEEISLSSILLKLTGIALLSEIH